MSRTASSSNTAADRLRSLRPCSKNLPDELLLFIFEEATRSKTTECDDNITESCKVLAGLCQVSKRWNKVAMTPSLWSTIRITPYDDLTPRVYLERSSGALLNVVVEYGYTPVSSTHNAVCSREKATSVLGPVLPHIVRWRSLRVSAGREPLRAVLHDLQGAHAPRLERLEFALCEMEITSADFAPPVTAFHAEGLPSLRSVRLYGFLPIAPVCIALPKLRKLELVHALEHVVEWDQFYGLLSGTSCLENLTISPGHAAVFDERVSPRIQLPTLMSLRVDFLFDHQSTIFEILDLPNLEELQLSWISDWEVFFNSLYPPGFPCSARFPRVKSLELRMMKTIPKFSDFRFFGSFPALEILILDGIDDVEPFFTAIQGVWVNGRTGDARVAWPLLKEVRWRSEMTNESDQEQMGTLLSSRHELGYPLQIILT